MTRETLSRTLIATGLVVLFCIFAVWMPYPADAQTYPIGGEAYAYEAVTVATPATRLTATLVSPGAGALSAQVVLITTETADMRYRYDGTDPTASEGHLAVSGSTVIVTGINNIRRLRLIRTTGTSATLRVTYLR